jgi:hypothetical protein
MNKPNTPQKNPSQLSKQLSKEELKETRKILSLIQFFENKKISNTTDKTYIQQISDQLSTLQDFQTLYKDIFENSKAIKYTDNTTSTIFEYIKRNQTNFTTIINTLNSANDLHQQAQTNLTDINTLKQEYETEINTLKEQITQQQETQKKTFENKIQEFDDLKQESEAEINTLKEQLTNQHKTQEQTFQNTMQEFTKTHTDLQDKIQSLLPSALIANLSATYKQSKNSYNPSNLVLINTKFEKVSFKNHPCTYIGIKLKSFGGILLRYTIFLSPLVLLIWLNINSYLKDTFILDIKFPEIKSYLDLLIRILQSAPFGIISLYGYNMIKRNNTLFEEYHHKENVIALYEGLIKKLEENKRENQDLIKSLNELIINTVALNPNQNIKNSKPPLTESAEKLIKNFLTQKTNKSE